MWHHLFWWKFICIEEEPAASILKVEQTVMGVAGFSRMSVKFYHITWCHIPELSILPYMFYSYKHNFYVKFKWLKIIDLRELMYQNE